MDKRVKELRDSNRVSIGKAIKREIFKSKPTLIAVIFLILVLVVSITAGFFIETSDLFRVNWGAKFIEPFTNVNGTFYILGTDEGGKDIFKLLLIGTRNSIFIGWTVAIISGIIGITLGMISGFFGGLIDNIIMRIVDFLIVIPALMFQIAVIITIENYTVTKFIMVLVFFQWLNYVRVIRAKALQESAQEYILASKVLGTPMYKIIFREMMPNLMSIILLRMTLAIALSIGIETGLTYLGYGLPAGTPSLGTLVNFAKNTVVMEYHWWVWLPATVLVLLLMLSINALGQALKRAFDSRQRI